MGTRGSLLAQRQANQVRESLAQAGVASEIVIIRTSGDKFHAADISKIGVKGVFIKELEDALLDGRVDLAVHSMKDVPTEVPSGLFFAAICKREDVHDCLVSRTGLGLRDLLPNARVGTSSLRRKSQLRHFRADLELLDVRGNVDTRLRKVEHGEYDAVVLAKAGLDRLGWSDRITEVISTDVSLPAVGQGALGVETRADDTEVVRVLMQLDDAETRVAITAERALLAELEGGCQVPLGALGNIEQGELRLKACVLSVDGSDYVRKRAVGSPQHAEELGRELARTLLAAGADRILRLAGRNVGGR